MAESDLDLARFGTAFKAFMEAAIDAAEPPSSPLLDRIAEHLGADPSQLPVISEEYDSFDQPNFQVAMDEYIQAPGRHADLVGIAADNKGFGSHSLSDFLSRGHAQIPLDEGPVDYMNFRLAGDQVLACVHFGLYLVDDADRKLVVFVAGPVEHSPFEKLRVDVLAPEPEIGQAFLREIGEFMARLNVYRGHIISLAPGEFGPGRHPLIAFHTLPLITREDVILPEGVLERIERETVVFAEQAERLRAAGRSLKRGLLLFGPPGVGKTLTIEYLCGRMLGRTIFLTSGLGLGLLQPVMQLARALAPSMVVLEDVDLIAQERMMPGAGTNPLLFQLLNEMDGLKDDCDVIFLLTTNRAELLEAALAARPGRIDLAVELPLPDKADRVRLLELYARGLELSDVDLDALSERIEGATPAYIKELLRKAAVLAATEGPEMVVTPAHVETALAELDAGGRLAQRLLGFHSEDELEPEPISTPTGFPHSTGWFSYSARVRHR